MISLEQGAKQPDAERSCMNGELPSVHGAATSG
jgi:hypothetical protein